VLAHGRFEPVNVMGSLAWGRMDTLSESQFAQLAEATLGAIERALERVADSTDLDLDFKRQGNVLEIECENGSKIIVNSNAPVQEIWVAAKSGGFHFRRVEAVWCNARDGSELFASLSRLLSLQCGVAVVLTASG